MPASPGKDHKIDMRRLAASLGLILLPSVALAFERDLSPEGVSAAFRSAPAWPRLLAGVPGVPRPRADEALRLAALAWTGVPGSWFTFSGPDDGQRPWIRVEIFETGWPHDPLFVAHTERAHGSPPGAILSATLRLNAQHHRFCVDPCPPGAIPLRPVLLHELGHALGLAHSGVRGTVMAPGLGKDPSSAPLSLSDDDRRGLLSLYGGSVPPPPPPAPPVNPPIRGVNWLAIGGLLGAAGGAVAWRRGGGGPWLWLGAAALLWSFLSAWMHLDGHAARAVLLPVDPARYYAVQAVFVGPLLLLLTAVHAAVAHRLARGSGGGVTFRQSWRVLAAGYGSALLLCYLLPDLIAYGLGGRAWMARAMRYHAPLMPLVMLWISGPPFARLHGISRARATLWVFLGLLAQLVLGAPWLR